MLILAVKASSVRVVQFIITVAPLYMAFALVVHDDSVPDPPSLISRMLILIFFFSFFPRAWSFREFLHFQITQSYLAE